MYRPEVVQLILSMYVNGVSIEDIAQYVGAGVKEVNEILDAYAPFL